ncbi:MAG: amidohydrolase [Candidatus Nanopelagicales bacterium]
MTSPDPAPRGSSTDGREVAGNGADVLDPAATARIDDWVGTHEGELVAFRRRLHAEPELSFEEDATTDAVMERLNVDGLTPHRLDSGTGLWVDIGSDGPIVALRAELDALAMDDVKDVPYRSRNPGVAHACGHDVHTPVVLGTGLLLHRLAREGLLPGRVRLLFEPGEEKVPGGAVEVVEAGLLGGVESVFAVHCDPKLDIGTLGTRIGAITSASDLVEVTLAGPGGHTARPGRTVDLVTVMAEVVTRVPELVTERMGGPHNCRLVFGSIHAGAAANVIPSHGVISGSLRTPDHDAWDLAPVALRESLDQVLAPSGASWELRHVRGVPPVINAESAARLLARSGRSFLGTDAVIETEHSWGGDSFGWMTSTVPGAFVRLGTHDPDRGDHLDLHHSRFDVDERCIAIGVRTLARTALAALAEA